MDHVATGLSNLTGLLQATNRTDKAEPLYRRALSILENFTRSTRDKQTHLQTFADNYVGLLQKMDYNQELIMT